MDGGFGFFLDFGLVCEEGNIHILAKAKRDRIGRMTYCGHVRNGQSMLDEPARLPEGARVQVAVMGEREDRRRSLLRMPLDQRREALRRQAEGFAGFYEADPDRDDWQGGDIVEWCSEWGPRMAIRGLSAKGSSFCLEQLVRLREDDLRGRLLAGVDVFSGSGGLIERDAADGRLGFLLDLRLGLAVGGEVGADEAALVGEGFL